ncbi:MAG: M15 family metallopeptidase [Bacteroidia bacterium]|nr:M15 family metallopeptidase [Bacteroidia bacterium]MDW8346585.1 M15 family metallopeptidase [Bacteroidia bacterium]
MIVNKHLLDKVRVEVQEVVKAIADRTEKELGLNIKVTEGCRTYEVQEAYYAQGRKPLEEVNKLRKKAGLPPIEAKKNLIITYAPAGHSAHNVCAAADIYLLDKNNKLVLEDYTLLKKFYAIVRKEVDKRNDITWGMDFTEFKDPPHLEYKHYRTLINKNTTVSTNQISSQNKPNNTPNSKNNILLFLMALGAITFAVMYKM